MEIRTSETEFYVRLRKPQGNIAGVPTGKTRKREDGQIEAEFISMSPRSNCSTIWATKEEIV